MKVVALHHELSISPSTGQDDVMKREEQINKIIKDEKLDTNLISDGYHTFGELYEHRIALFITLCNNLNVYANKKIWKSRKHSDGTSWDGWFIAGIGKEPGTQISYHLPMKVWYSLHVDEIEKAPEWDGHTPADVVERLLKV